MGRDSPGAAPPTWWRPVFTVAAFSLLPFAVFLNDNRAEVALDFGLVLYGLAVFALGLTVVLAGNRLRGGSARERVAVVFAAAVFVFFQFQLALSAAELVGFPPDAGAAALAIWLALFVAALLVAARVSRHAFAWNFAAVAGALLLALPLAQFAHFKATDSPAATAGTESTEAPGAGSGSSSAPARKRPDIYFFLLDGYGRADQLEATVGFDNSAFLRSLERRGFKVFDNATSAYSTTFLSLASTLDMAYPAPPGELANHLPYYRAIEGDNETGNRLHELGYELAFATDYSLFDCGGEVDLCVEPAEDAAGALIGERGQAILAATPLSEVLPAIGIEASALTGYLSPTDAVEQVERARSDRPVFAYTHIIAPHPPYRYLEGCELKTDLRDTSVSYWGEARGSGGEEYLQAIRCLNRELLAAVDAILERDDDAIVVIQGDHGPKFGFDLSRPLSEWSQSELEQRFSILNAQRIPPGCSQSGPGAGFAANTFGAVLGCITGHEFEPLPLRHYTLDSGEQRVEQVDDAVLDPGGDE